MRCDKEQLKITIQRETLGTTVNEIINKTQVRHIVFENQKLWQLTGNKDKGKLTGNSTNLIQKSNYNTGQIIITISQYLNFVKFQNNQALEKTS